MITRKTLATLASAACLSVSGSVANAQSAFYIGAGALFGGSGTFDNSVAGTKTDNDTSGSSLKLGYILGNGHRIEFSYSSVDLEFPTVTRQVTGFDFDYLFTFGADRLKPYIGVGIGAYTFEDSAQFFVENKDLTGVALNVSGGLIYEVSSNFEIEAALRFKTIESKDIQVGATTGTWNQTMTNFFLGANVRF